VAVLQCLRNGIFRTLIKCTRRNIFVTNILHLLIPRFINSLCVITIKLNTLSDVPYQMTVGGAFVYVRENLGKRSRLSMYPVDSVIMK